MSFCRGHSSAGWGWAVVLLALLSLSARAQFPALAENELRASVSQSGVVVRAASEDAARSGLTAVLRMHAEVCRAFAVTSPPPRFVAWFTNMNEWIQFRSRSGASEPQSLSVDGEVAILVTDVHANEPLAHELVHVVLRQTSRAPLPLWFEEGCALYFGWRTAQSIARADGRRLVRTLPAQAEEVLIDTAVLLSAKVYPDALAGKRAFYRQSEEMVRALDEKLGDEGVRKLLDALARDADLVRCLRREFEYGEGDVSLIAEMMRARATHRQSW